MARRSKNSARSLNGHFTDPLAPRGACGGPAIARGIQAERARSAGKAARSGRYLPRFLLRAGGDSVQGDFRGPEVLGRIPPALPQRRVDLVLSGAAPPLRGIDAADQLRPMCLTEAGLDRGGRVLKRGRDALIKVFRGCGSQEFVQDGRGRFAKVKPIKPAASP